jgi:hypothetical protein
MFPAELPQIAAGWGGPYLARPDKSSQMAGRQMPGRSESDFASCPLMPIRSCERLPIARRDSPEGHTDLAGRNDPLLPPHRPAPLPMQEPRKIARFPTYG